MLLHSFFYPLLLLHAFLHVRGADQAEGGDTDTPAPLPSSSGANLIPSSSSPSTSGSNNNTSSGNNMSSSSSMGSSGIDVDCKGGYGAWSPCEPLEGHDTHHDSEDEFNLQRGPDGYYVGECFQYRTYHVITPSRGNGNKCSKKDGSKVFRYCNDCSAVPAVYKHLQAAPSPQVSSIRFFAVVAGLLCLVTTIVFVAICLKKTFMQDTQQPPAIPLYPPSPSTHEAPRQHEAAKGLCLAADEATQAAPSR
ncbi:hypothetical protein, conserved [Eimeria maxima]|uniref:Uncharacterized protein n=1 Tax=Eimeria maxima TaxID=5804 RepID=U6LYX7_EIMMA|nr:hypothetical protein, conserved [Eimeria maxima]CDJ57157.1 hypothetical protein, conserved [Eimeria maxima]